MLLIPQLSWQGVFVPTTAIVCTYCVLLCSVTRELHDAPALIVGRAAVSYMLAACEGLNPANMALLSELLVGPSVTGGVRCLYDYPKGRFMLRLAARHWHQLTTGMPAQGVGRGKVAWCVWQKNL